MSLGQKLWRQENNDNMVKGDLPELHPGCWAGFELFLLWILLLLGKGPSSSSPSDELNMWTFSTSISLQNLICICGTQLLYFSFMFYSIYSSHHIAQCQTQAVHSQLEVGPRRVPNMPFMRLQLQTMGFIMLNCTGQLQSMIEIDYVEWRLLGQGQGCLGTQKHICASCN